MAYIRTLIFDRGGHKLQEIYAGSTKNYVCISDIEDAKKRASSWVKENNFSVVSSCFQGSEYKLWATRKK